MAACEHNRAEILELARRNAQAEGGYLRSVETLRDLVRRHPEAVEFAGDLSNSEQQLGRLLLSRGERDRGSDVLASALGRWEGLIARFPKNTRFLYGRAYVLVLLGRYDEAVKAVEVLASAPGGGEVAPHLGAATALAFNLPRTTPDPAAEIRVAPEWVLSFADRAMAYLARAIDLGEISREELQSTPEFEVLKPRVDFDSLKDRPLDRGFPSDPFLR